MRDINFFEDYIETKHVKLGKSLLLPILKVFVFAFLIGYGLFKELEIKNLTLDNETLRIVAEDPKTANQIRDLEAKEEEIRVFNSQRDRVKDLDSYLKRNDRVKEDFHKLIFTKLPEDIYLTSYNLSGGGLSLSGISKKKLSVAAFRKALEEVKGIDNVYIGSVTGQDGQFTFNISANFEGVDLND